MWLDKTMCDLRMMNERWEWYLISWHLSRSKWIRWHIFRVHNSHFAGRLDLYNLNVDSYYLVHLGYIIVRSKWLVCWVGGIWSETSVFCGKKVWLWIGLEWWRVSNELIVARGHCFKSRNVTWSMWRCVERLIDRRFSSRYHARLTG